MEDDISKLPMCASGKKYARRKGLAQLGPAGVKLWDRMTTDLSNETSQKLRIKSPGVTLKLRKSENLRIKQLVNLILDSSERRIVAAAIRLSDGKIFTGICHGDAASKANKETGCNIYADEVECGFMTSEGVFVSRKEAMDIALSAKQLRHRPRDNDLDSDEIFTNEEKLAALCK